MIVPRLHHLELKGVTVGRKKGIRSKENFENDASPSKINIKKYKTQLQNQTKHRLGMQTSQSSKHVSL